MAKILKPIILITIPEPTPNIELSGGNKGYNGLGIHRKEVTPESGISKLEEDQTPKLGGDLDVNLKEVKKAKKISFGDSDIVITFFEDYTQMPAQAF